MTITIHPYLAEIEVSLKTMLDGEVLYTMWRLVFAKDKNEATEKVHKYMRDVYTTRTDTKFHVSIKDTIV